MKKVSSARHGEPSLGRARLGLLAACLATLGGSATGCEQQDPGLKPLPQSATANRPGVAGSGAAAATSSQKPGACQASPRANDPANIAYLPAVVGNFCLDPAGSDKAYGEEAPQGVDGICDAVDGECELYKRAGVRRFVELRYVDGAGAPATIDLYLSRYGSPDQAFAMYTQRVVGDGDPARPDGPRPIASAGRAALGQGNAVLWRGSFLAEMTLSDERASAPALKQQGDELFPKLAQAIAERLPGTTELPVAARALPPEGLVPGGIRYFATDLLAMEGTGPGAVGYYADGERRWRALRADDGDEARAKDVLKAFARRTGSSTEKGLGEDAVRFMAQDATGAPLAEWLVARAGAKVVGIGDESTVLRDGMPAAERTARTLTTADKRTRLRSWLAAGPAKSP
jgi:hypothetical protein